MKKVLLTLVFGLFFVAFSNAQSASTIKKAKSEFTVKNKKAADYQCPMDCEKGKTYDKAGTCPVCKMDLKAKKSGKKAKGCCSGSKAKSSCGSKKAKSSCGDKKVKSSCGDKKAKSSCSGKKKSSCGGK